uniref:Cathepsin propeptide inhibitor domain-containing protein n=1 Tax=Oryza glumipatula TaxID=40148 RepID=A0A0E0B6P1_9ORYZ
MAASAPQPHVPFTDEDLGSEESMWSLYERWRGAMLPVHTSSSSHLGDMESRFEAFKANARYVSEFNKKEDMTYKLGLNKFADMTLEEFVAKYTGTKVDAAAMARAPEAEEELELELAGDVPASWDWRQHGAVTPAREQGTCELLGVLGGWRGGGRERDRDGEAGDAVGAAGAGLLRRRRLHRRRVVFPGPAWLRREAGDQPGWRNTPVPVVKMDGAVDVPASEAALKRSVYRAPVAVSIEATQSLQLYKEDWGDNGFGRMKRDVIAKEGLCGIAMYGVYSVKNGHKNCSYPATPAVVASY